MSQNRITKLLEALPGTWTPPALSRFEKEGLDLLECGVLLVLSDGLSESAALKALRSLRSHYPDWNELRVSQIQEFQGLLQTKSKDLQRELARKLKAFLQEVFQKVHGFDLEPLREDPAEAAKLASQMDEFGPEKAHVLLLLILGGESPASLGLIRVLDRAGLMKRTSSIRKASEALAKLVPEASRPLFAARFGALVRYCDAKRPTCWECPLHDDCGFGKKVYRDWQAQQKRLADQRKREEEMRRKAEERERKREEALEKKRAEKLAKEEAKRRRMEEAAKRREEAARKKAEAKKKAAAKKAAAKKAAAKKAAAKKAAAKKAAAKKAAAKKAAAKKKDGGKKKAAKKRSPKKKTSTSRAKPSAKKKPAAKKKGAKKPAVKKKPAAKKKAKKTRR